MLNGIVWKIRAGVAWRDVPERYGPWRSICTRFRRWALDGTFTRMPAAVQTHRYADWLVAVDSTLVRAHRHAAGAKRGTQAGTNRKITPSADPEED